MLPQGLLLNACRNSVVGIDRDLTICHTNANFKSEIAFQNLRHLYFFFLTAFIAVNSQQDSAVPVQHTGKNLASLFRTSFSLPNSYKRRSNHIFK